MEPSIIKEIHDSNSDKEPKSEQTTTSTESIEII